MAKEIRGADVLIKVGGVAVAGQRDCTLSMNGDEIDTTTKTNEGWKTFLQGLKDWSMDLDFVNYFGEPAESQKVLKRAFLNGQTIQAVMTFGTEEVYSGEAAITSMNLSGQMSDVSTASLTIKGASALDCEFAPALSNTAISGSNKIVTMAFTTAIQNNLTDAAALKAAITFASNGTTFSALGGSDTVTIDNDKLIVTFNSAITGSSNKIKIAADTLKTANGAIQGTAITTPAIAAA